MARPKKTLNQAKEIFPVDWYDQILKEYSEGASDAEIRAMLILWLKDSFSFDLWDRWMNEEPEFSESIKMGRALSESWWKKTGRKNLLTKDFSFTGWYMNMKNRFGWSDKTTQQIEQKNINIESNLSDEELKKQINELNERIK